MYGHPMTPPKSRRRSRTYWINGLILAFLGAESQLNILQPLLPVNVYVIAAFALPVINLVLRELTTAPVGKIKNPPPPTLPPYPAPSEPGHE
jgi:hypothetical protein